MTLSKSIDYLTRPLFLSRLIAYKIHLRLHPEEPWIAPSAVKFCDEALNRDGQGLEWGSGRSTTWFARRLRSLLSIEYDQGWQARVSATLREQGLTSAECRYVPLDHPRSAPTPAVYPETPAYVRVAEEFADDSLDLVVVDGHYRTACILAAIPKIKPGGLLVVDNTDRMPLPEWGVPADWPVAHQGRNVVTETTVWRKP